MHATAVDMRFSLGYAMTYTRFFRRPKGVGYKSSPNEPLEVEIKVRIWINYGGLQSQKW